ncbi:MAG TPA: hypothetical protein VF541_04420 [Longimicrobium sp.]|jgi:hypothetical protein
MTDVGVVPLGGGGGGGGLAKEAPKGLSGERTAKRQRVLPCHAVVVEEGPAVVALIIRPVVVGTFPRPLAAGAGHAIPRDLQNLIGIRVTQRPAGGGAVVWTVNGAGAAAAVGDADLLEVNGTVAARLVVRATLGDQHDELTLWVFRVTVDVLVAGNLPGAADCAIDFGLVTPDHIHTTPRALGRVDGNDSNGRPMAQGRICVRGTLTPAGAHVALRTSFRVVRTITREKTWADGALVTNRTNAGDTNARPDQKQWRVNDNDRIYDLDAPSIACWYPGAAAIETYMSFSQHVTWQGTRCSDDVAWHFIGEYLNGTPAAALQDAPGPAPQNVVFTPGAGMVHWMVVAAGALNVAGIAAPRYTVTAGAPPTLHNAGRRQP